MPASILYARCVAVIGATSGIGRDLALAIHSLPTNPTVIAVGRRADRLDELAARSKNGQGKFDTVQFDVTAGRDVMQRFVDHMLKEYPQLDAIIMAQGVQRSMNFRKPETIQLPHLLGELNTNLVSVMALTALFMPHLLELNDAGKNTFIIPVSSNLGISPVPGVPGYCASKAALHSFVLSLTAQMHGTNVNVIEIIPSVVQTELHGGGNSGGMPLDEFTRKTMDGLKKGEQFVITAPNVEKRFARWEAGKLDHVLQFVKR